MILFQRHKYTFFLIQFYYLHFQKCGGKFHEENSTLSQKYLFGTRMCVVCSAQVFQVLCLYLNFKCPEICYYNT